MGIIEYFENNIIDADIYIDYENGSIEFKKRYTYEKLFGEAIGIAIFFYIFVTTTTLISFFNNKLSEYHFLFIGEKIANLSNIIFYNALTLFPISIIACFGLFVLPNLIHSSNIPMIRDWVHKNMRNHLMGSLEIVDPAGTIIYRTNNPEPLIDLEYDKDISDALTKVSLVKEKIKKKVLFGLSKSEREMIVMIINFSRSAKGVLSIKEY